tara:strand:+ start:215 stop:1327 length:1113 start_codon:yes stop_codon:yes gene_type:complete
MNVITENNVIPKLRFKGFSDEWNKVILGNLVNTISSGNSKCEESGLFDVYGSTGKIGVCSKYSHQGKYILAARVGANAGLLNYVDGSFGVSGNTLVLDLNDDLSSTRFIFYSLLSFNLNRLVFGSGQPLITGGQLKKLKLNLPGKAEQLKIASFINTVDKNIEQLKKKKNLLKEYKKGVMQRIFFQELRFKDDSGNSYPDWEEKKLGIICKINKGVQFNKSLLSKTGKYPCINGGKEPSGYSDKFNSNPNTITISEGGNSCGFVNLIKLHFWSGGHCYKIEDIDESVDLLYLYYFLKFNQKRIMILRQGSSLPGLPKKGLLNFIIKTPSFSEQRKIGLLIDSLNDKIELVNTQIENTKALKKGLLQQMFV